MVSALCLPCRSLSHKCGAGTISTCCLPCSSILHKCCNSGMCMICARWLPCSQLSPQQLGSPHNPASLHLHTLPPPPSCSVPLPSRLAIGSPLPPLQELQQKLEDTINVCLPSKNVRHSDLLIMMEVVKFTESGAEMMVKVRMGARQAGVC